MLGTGFQSLDLAFEAGREYYKAVRCKLFGVRCYFHAVHFALSKHSSVLGRDYFLSSSSSCIFALSVSGLAEFQARVPIKP